MKVRFEAVFRDQGCFAERPKQSGVDSYAEDGQLECADCGHEGSWGRDRYVFSSALMVHAGCANAPPLPAKNVCLAGVKSVTIHDPEPTTQADLGTQVSISSSGCRIAPQLMAGAASVLSARHRYRQSKRCVDAAAPGRAELLRPRPITGRKPDFGRTQGVSGTWPHSGALRFPADMCAHVLCIGRGGHQCTYFQTTRN